MDLGDVLEQTQGDAVNRGITPSLIEESSGSIQMLKISLICRASPKVQIPDFEIAPEMASTIPIGTRRLLWPE